jgi:hypothetical protein
VKLAIQVQLLLHLQPPFQAVTCQACTWDMFNRTTKGASSIGQGHFASLQNAELKARSSIPQAHSKSACMLQVRAEPPQITCMPQDRAESP